MPSGIDSLSIVMRSADLPPEKEETVKRRLFDEVGAESVMVTRGLSIVMIVGAAMARTVGVTARAASALAKAGVNLEVINQGASEISVMFGVREEFCDAIRELYKSFPLIRRRDGLDTDVEKAAQVVVRQGVAADRRTVHIDVVVPVVRIGIRSDPGENR